MKTAGHVSRETIARAANPAGMLWYVVYTNATKEGFANDFLSGQLGLQTLFLHYRDKTTHARKVRDVIRPFFPRYIFVGLGPRCGLSSVNNAMGVSTVLYCGDKPLTVPRPVMAALRARGDKNGVVEVTPKEKQQRRRFKTGQSVRIQGGPFEGFMAQVVLDTGREIRLWVEGLSRFAGKPVTMELPREAISPNLRSYA